MFVDGIFVVNGFVAVGAHSFAHGARYDARTVAHKNIRNTNTDDDTNSSEKVIYYI